MSRRPPILDGDELKGRLAALAKSKPPKAELPAACCYRMAAPPSTAEYVCPEDGERTQYARDSGLVDFVLALPAMRSLVVQLEGLDASLDERSLCRKCTPGPVSAPSVALVIRHEDGRTARTEGVGTFDLEILREFLAGELEHAGRHGTKTALKQHLPRLRALLGLDQ